MLSAAAVAPRPAAERVQDQSKGQEEGSSTGSSALITESHPSKFFLEPLLFGDVRRLYQPVGKIEELFLFLLARLEAALDQFHHYPVGARTFALCQGLNTSCNVRWQADALADG